MGDEGELKRRTKAFALKVIEFAEGVPETKAGRVIAGQLLRSGTSAGANYRAATRARSTADFISKMGIVEEETDESMYWMEVLMESGLAKTVDVRSLYEEADEILAMTVASINTAKKRSK